MAIGVNVLINNAGVLAQTSLAEAGTINPLKAEMDVNVFGVARTSLAFADVIRRNGGGTIVNVLSTTSILPFPPFGTYSASKAAAMSLTQSMRWDYEPFGIRVVGVYFGLMDTHMVENIEGKKLSPASVAEAIVSGIELDQLDICIGDDSAKLVGKFQSALGSSLHDVMVDASLFRQSRLDKMK